MKEPKGIKGTRRKLLQEALKANREMKKAVLAASDAIDRQSQELTALRRILISERAQVIYYSDKYLAFLNHECFDVQPANFLTLEESQQEPYIIRAIKELSADEGIVPHEKETVAKKIILPN